ncbi:MAG: hypothetical protein ABIH11_07030 [Candidatus Altiarchaeota archaeon]
MAKEEDGKWYHEYLPESEEVIGEENIGFMGFYSALVTKERVVFVRRFPKKSFVEVRLDEIISLEHLTRTLWGDMIKGTAMIVGSGLIYQYQQTADLVTPIKNLLIKYLPELSGIPVPKAILFFLIVMSLMGVFHILRFVPSNIGKLKISRKNRSPLLIPTRLNSNTKKLVRNIESMMTEKDKDRGKPIIVTTGMGGAREEDDKISPTEKIKKSLDEGVKGLRDHAIIIASAKSKDHGHVVSALLENLIKEKGMGGVYISVSRPYDDIIELIEESGSDSSNVFFVDCISQMAGKLPEGAENVVFVENPGSLEEVSMFLDRMLGKVQTEKKFLFLDSLSSLLIYNNDKSVKEFTHFMINKMRLEKISGIILSTEKKEAEEMVKTLVPMCDTEIRF